MLPPSTRPACLSPWRKQSHRLGASRLLRPCFFYTDRAATEKRDKIPAHHSITSSANHPRAPSPKQGSYHASYVSVREKLSRAGDHRHRDRTPLFAAAVPNVWTHGTSIDGTSWSLVSVEHPDPSDRFVLGHYRPKVVLCTPAPLRPSLGVANRIGCLLVNVSHIALQRMKTNLKFLILKSLRKPYFLFFWTTIPRGGHV